MVTVVLVRHAATAWSGRRYCGRADPALSAIGRRQAARLADTLAPVLPDDARVVTSPSRRAVATATAIADAAGLGPIETDDRWCEADVGIAEGLAFDQLAAVQPALAAALGAGLLEVDWPGGETHMALARRVEAAWADLLVAGRPAVVVTHAGPLLWALALAEERAPSSADLVATAEARWMSVPVRPDADVLLPSVGDPSTLDPVGSPGRGAPAHAAGLLRDRARRLHRRRGE